MRRFLCFGDSIVAGSDMPPDERGQIWPSMVNSMAQGAIECINAGRGGRPTDSFPEFSASLAENSPIDFILLALGTNDSRDLSDACPHQAVINLEAMIVHARKAGISRVLLVAPCDLCLEALGETKPIGPQRQLQLDRITEASRELARKLQVDFVSLAGIVSPKNLTRDGVHPNAAGNREIASFLLPMLLKMARDT